MLFGWNVQVYQDRQDGVRNKPIWIHSAEQLFPLWCATEEAGDLLPFQHAAGTHWHLHTYPHPLRSDTKEVAGGFKVCPQCSQWMTGPFGRINLRQAQQFGPPPASLDAFGVFLPSVFLWWQNQSLEQLILLPISWEIWATFGYVSVSM